MRVRVDLDLMLNLDPNSHLQSDLLRVAPTLTLIVLGDELDGSVARPRVVQRD